MLLLSFLSHYSDAKSLEREKPSSQDQSSLPSPRNEPRVSVFFAVVVGDVSNHVLPSAIIYNLAGGMHNKDNNTLIMLKEGPC